ncbi:MAG: DUF2480 family protein [Mucilaginibacter polytrichastri]|nr:DUF2480 family protein [Mucilaginibacter polytrichastri]
MEIQENIVNKVAQSGLITIDLSTIRPAGERVVYDVKDNLFHGMILREKDFREFIKTHDWTQYSGKQVAITCSADAIVQTWAYMLLVTKISPYASEVLVGDAEALETMLFSKAIAALDVNIYRDERIVIKGCSDDVPAAAYAELTRRLTGVAKSIMFGEPCSTVPVYKRRD